MSRSCAFLIRLELACLVIVCVLFGGASVLAEELSSTDVYAAFVRGSMSGAKNAAGERLQRVEEAQAAFCGDSRQSQAVGAGERQGRQAVSVRKPQLENSREATQAALLAVYDENGNGRLDAEEHTRIGRDRALVSAPSSLSQRRWKRMEERIATNPKIAEESRARILDSVRRRHGVGEGSR